MSEELHDFFDDLPSSSDLTNLMLGSRTTEDLGDVTLQIHTTDGEMGVFDSVRFQAFQDTVLVVGMAAVRVEGKAHLLPEAIHPLDRVSKIYIPMDDGRVEAADAKLIGIKGDQDAG